MLNGELNQTFLRLVRLGIGHKKGTLDQYLDVNSHTDWEQLKALAEKQGLSAVVLDGIDSLQHKGLLHEGLPKQLRLEWIGQVLQNYEYRYERYRRAIAELAALYNSHGFRMMVLKGYACALDWPKPAHRPCGDIDIWQFGQQREADAVLANTDFTNCTDEGSPKGLKSDKNLSQNSSRIRELENKVTIDSSHHHHTVFHWHGFMVENHYDFINVHHHRSHVELEHILKALGDASNLNDNSVHDIGMAIPSIEIDGEQVWLPSPNLHALFLMKHMSLHFSTGEFGVRQLLDWGFFVKAHGKEVDWGRIEKVYEHFRMKQLYGIFNAICVCELGFDVGDFNFVQFEPALKDRVLNEILAPESFGDIPTSLFPRLLFKYRRWKANEWKHKLCYKDSMWSAFWSGVWSHLLKPSSI